MLVNGFFHQHHAVSRTQQGRQREPSAKTFSSPFSAEFWMHCMLSGETKRRAFASTRHQSEKSENIHLNTY